jgi:hypothetical protein
MTRKRARTLLAPAIAMLLLASGAHATGSARFAFDLETGRVSTGYNNLRIPGKGGTKLSLVDDLRSEPGAFLRLRAIWTIVPRHQLSVLYAPLTLEAAGRADRPITFTDVTFPARTPLTARYTFNSYRLTYRYAVHASRRLSLGVGLTAKIRDAVIEVRGAGETGRKTNVGFVPLLHFDIDWRLGPRLGLTFGGDALAAPQGRAEDVQLALRYSLGPRITLRGGYRLLEGGADNDQVYTFALLHYAIVGLTVAL